MFALKTTSFLAVAVVLLLTAVEAKIYERCELAEEMYHVYNVPLEQLPVWVCIAKHTSNFNTKITNHRIGFGIFGIGNKFWCSLKEEKRYCNVKCADLENDDIANDVNCIEIIYNRTKRVQGNGYLAWDAYKNICKFDPDITTYVKGCNLTKVQEADILLPMELDVRFAD